jgi:hypothetical protein
MEIKKRFTQWLYTQFTPEISCCYRRYLQTLTSASLVLYKIKSIRLRLADKDKGTCTMHNLAHDWSKVFTTTCHKWNLHNTHDD